MWRRVAERGGARVTGRRRPGVSAGGAGSDVVRCRVLSSAERARGGARAASGAQFTCFTGTKVQILTQNVLRVPLQRHTQRHTAGKRKGGVRTVGCWARHTGPAGMLTYAHVCSRMLTFAHVCSRMLARMAGCWALHTGPTGMLLQQMWSADVC